MRSSTVLPEPLPPITTSVSPCRASKLTPAQDLLRPRTPSTTSRDLQAERPRRVRVIGHHQKSMRKSLVRKKSETITPIATCTTVAVVARPSPSVPPSVASPL